MMINKRVRTIHRNKVWGIFDLEMAAYRLAAYRLQRIDCSVSTAIAAILV
ncbi:MULTISPECIES: hypothetical protein [unclassified Vibrio]